nr:hypothetical protein [Tanacetum cinerariifolium]
MLKFLVERGIATIRSTILIPTECASVTTSSVIPREERTCPANFTVALHPDFPDQEIVIGGSLSDKGRIELCYVLKKNLDIFSWQPSDMTGVPRSVAEHRLNIQEGYSPVWEKKIGQAPERARAIQAEVQKLVDAEIMREVYYHDWLCNPVMVKKHDGSWRMCVDFTDLNKARPQDCYPLPEIDWKVESLCGYPFKYSWQKQTKRRQLSTQDRDDLVVKSYTEAEMMRDIEETFRTLRKVNMKLNPKKCSCGLAEGVFLGYVITPEGIKPCSDKTAAVLQLPSPQTIKETAEAKQAFQQLKQHLSELPLLVAPKPQEELIMYLSATYGAVSAVLMTERGTTQTPIYFISRALQGPELNYSPMEKLVLSLIFAAKRLRRYFQAHPIMVITDQPIKQVMTRPDVTGRLQKWSIMLGEHNITYRPRTSVKGQILADFLIELPGDISQAASAAVTQEEPWTLFTDGSSCVDGSGVNVDSKLVTNQVLGTYVAKEDNMIKYLEIVKGLVLVEVLENKSIKKKEVAAVIEEDGPTWMTHLVDYLKEGVLSGDKKEAMKLRLKARQYELIEGVLYRRSFLTPWLRCVGPLQADYVMREIHEGSCSMHAGPRSVVAKAVRLEYYWPTMRKDARDMIRKCNDCPFPEGPGKVKFLIVTMDYFTKWIEAKAMATITGGQVKKFVWENIVCRFAVDVVNNDKELRLNLDLLEERRKRAALEPKWEGPYEVTEVLGNGAYKLRSTDRTLLPRTWNVTNLKRCYL